ncbi:MAG: hypothetical protein IJK23_10210 [Clostridia bacterium]|nr:hypothetical protein [Clostridia bacterium]
MNKNRNVFKDTQNAKFGDVYATIGGRRLHLMNVKNVKATSNVKTQEIPVLGNMIVGRKPTGMELKIVMTVYKVSETFDDMIETFKNTGVLPPMDLQVTNGPDVSSSIGSSTKIYRDCVIDGEVLLGMLDVEDKIVEQEITCYAMDYDSLGKFRSPDYL